LNDTTIFERQRRVPLEVRSKLTRKRVAICWPEVAVVLKRAHSLMSDVVEPVLERHGFTFIQYVILSWLRDGIALNPKDISLEFRHNSGALTRVIDQLVERGLLKRLRRDRDRRKVQLQLTAAGRETIEGLVPLVVERLDAALADVTGAEVQELLHLLIKLDTTLQSVTEPGMAVTKVYV
jgi:DNA-binding MarR family transcriptional regulator